MPRQVAICKASYTRPNNAAQSAARLHKYLEYRQDRDHPDRYERLPEESLFGDAERFKLEARERAAEGRRSAYVHVTISPERGDELTNDDYRELLKDWITDRNGEELTYFAAIHRDTDHHHMHVAVVRDKFQKRDLETRKEHTRELVRQQEQVRELEPERIQELLREPVQERGPEPERDLTPQPEPHRERGPERELEL